MSATSDIEHAEVLRLSVIWHFVYQNIIPHISHENLCFSRSKVMSNAVLSAESQSGDTETKGSIENQELDALPSARKNILLMFLCLAQFLDTFANSSLFAAIPPISVQLGISNSDSVWLISGYQLTFASLLLSVRLRFFTASIFST